MSEENKAKGQSPVLRAIERDGDGYKDVMVLWNIPKKEGGSFLNGFIMQGDDKVSVTGNYVEGPKGKFLSVRSSDGSLQFTGNAVNNVKTGDCNFDTVVFNIGDKPVFARITAAVSSELHEQMGFTSPRIEREKKEKSKMAM